MRARECDTLIEHNKKLSTVPSSPLWRGAAQRRGGQRIQESATPLSLRAQRSNPVNYARARMRDFIMTGSPRSLRSLAMTKSTAPSSPPLEGCRAAAGWSENTRKCYTSVIASAAKQSSKLCTRANATH